MILDNNMIIYFLYSSDLALKFFFLPPIKVILDNEDLPSQRMLKKIPFSLFKGWFQKKKVLKIFLAVVAAETA